MPPYARKRAGNHAAVFGRADGRELRRQGPWRRGYEVDRPSRICLCGRVERAILRNGFYVGGIRFHRPVLIGNMVEVSAKLIHTGVEAEGLMRFLPGIAALLALIRLSD